MLYKYHRGRANTHHFVSSRVGQTAFNHEIPMSCNIVLSFEGIVTFM
jgi:hypothetical protein